MDSSLLIAAGSLITVVGGVVVTLRKSSSDNKASTITGEVALSDYWEKRTAKIEDRYTILEEKFEEMRTSFENLSLDYIEVKKELENLRVENTRLTSENHARLGRITTLEAQVVELQSQLASYVHIDMKKVDAVKAELHHNVEDNLEELKK